MVPVVKVTESSSVSLCRKVFQGYIFRVSLPMCPQLLVRPAGGGWRRSQRAWAGMQVWQACLWISRPSYKREEFKGAGAHPGRPRQVLACAPVHVLARLIPGPPASAAPVWKRTATLLKPRTRFIYIYLPDFYLFFFSEKRHTLTHIWRSDLVRPWPAQKLIFFVFVCNYLFVLFFGGCVSVMIYKRAPAQFDQISA